MELSTTVTDPGHPLVGKLVEMTEDFQAFLAVRVRTYDTVHSPAPNLWTDRPRLWTLPGVSVDGPVGLRECRANPLRRAAGTT